MLFDEIMKSEKLQDPEIRKAGEIGRSNKKLKNKRSRSTSMSVGAFRMSLFIVGAILSISALAGLVYVAWKAIEIYIGG